MAIADRLSDDDKNVLLFVNLATLAALAFIVSLAVLTGYEMRPQDVAMVGVWWIGGTMTWGWTSWSRRRRVQQDLDA